MIHSVTLKKTVPVAALLVLMIAATACSKRRVFYECQCYQKGYHTNNYAVGNVPGKDVYDICHTIQKQNGEDTCYGSGSLK